MIKKIAYLGYDFFAGCLQKLIAEGYEVKWVFTSPPDGIYEFNDLVLATAAQSGAQVFSEPVKAVQLEFLQDEGCDLVISAAYPFKIPVILHSPSIINVHPSLLPRGRGPWPLPYVILNNDQVSGVSIHKVSKEFNAGDILAQSTFSISERENLESLAAKVQMKAPVLLSEVLRRFDDYQANALPQEAGEFWPLPADKMRTLNWKLPVSELDKIARAFGKSGSYAVFEGKKWLVEDLTVWSEPHNLQPGFVALRGNREAVLAASDGFVCLRHFYPDPEGLAAQR